MSTRSVRSGFQSPMREIVRHDSRTDWQLLPEQRPHDQIEGFPHEQEYDRGFGHVDAQGIAPPDFDLVLQPGRLHLGVRHLGEVRVDVHAETLLRSGLDRRDDEPARRRTRVRRRRRRS